MLVFYISREKSLWDIAIDQSKKNEGKDVVCLSSYSLCIIYILSYFRYFF